MMEYSLRNLSEGRRAWDQFLLEENAERGFKYTNNALDYFAMVSGSRLVKDLSFVASKGRAPVAICPLLLERIGDSHQFTMFEEALPHPIFSLKLGHHEREKVEKEVFEKVRQLCAENDVSKVVFLENALEKLENPFRLSFLEKKGWLKNSISTAVIDFNNDLADMWGQVRSSYRSLINKAQRECSFTIFDSSNFTDETGEAYRLMHHKAAGRVTRSKASFEKMYEMIKKNEAFLIEQKRGDKCIAYVLLFALGKHLFYASIADDVDAESQDLLHGWVWFVIKSFKEKGFKTLELGWLQFGPVWGRSASKKSVGISLFKSGFGKIAVPLNEFVLTSSKDVFEQWCLAQLKQYNQSAMDLLPFANNL